MLETLESIPVPNVDFQLLKYKRKKQFCSRSICAIYFQISHQEASGMYTSAAYLVNINLFMDFIIFNKQ